MFQLKGYTKHWGSLGRILPVFMLMVSISAYSAPIHQTLDQAFTEVGVPAAAVDTQAATDVTLAEGDDTQYGGILQQYVVEQCEVTVYRDGPVKMEHIKTSEPCDAPLPKDHQFSKSSRTYQSEGCTVTEYEYADGVSDAVKVCS